MLWKLLQAAIVIAVVATNIEYQWTPNPLIPAAAGAGIAFFVTYWLDKLFELFRRAREKPTLLSSEQRSGNSLRSGGPRFPHDPI